MKEVIKYSGKKDDLVWIYPKTTIRKDATIIVEAGYHAFMIRNGEADMPYFQGLNDVFTDKKTKFSLFKNKFEKDCTIYFFNLSKEIGEKEWGTRNPIKYFDKKFQLELTMRGHGNYKIQLENPRLFLRSFRIDHASIVKLDTMIKDFVVGKITVTIQKVLTSGKYDFTSIEEIKNATLEIMNQEFDSYGFTIIDLHIAYLAPLEEELVKKAKEVHKEIVHDKKEVVEEEVKTCESGELSV